jgi:lipopolysaccharide biosynthesis protein
LLPADLGFYDLRVPEVRAAQADLAASHGIEAFCYWHYWFAGRRVLARPFDEVLARGEPRLEFCLGWANENWTGIWQGERDRILVEQTYPGPDDHQRHFESVLPAFRDERYLTVDGEPLFFLHRPDLLPDLDAFAEQWRTLAAQAGLPGLYLVGESRHGFPVTTHGFDAQVVTPLLWLEARSKVVQLWERGVRRALRRPIRHPYRYLARHPRAVAEGPRPELPMVLANWDNTPRHGRNGFELRGATPARYGQALRAAVDAVQHLDAEHRLVFIKSWNEWAEGNLLEPSQRWRHGFLDATARVLVP